MKNDVSVDLHDWSVTFLRGIYEVGTPARRDIGNKLGVWGLLCPRVKFWKHSHSQSIQVTFTIHSSDTQLFGVFWCFWAFLGVFGCFGCFGMFLGIFGYI